MQESVCLDCEGPLSIPTDLHVGESLVCPRCKTELEIVNLDPPKFDWPHDSTYDNWDDDYEDDLGDDWLDEDDDDWVDDEDDDDYSWMLAKQKRHQELDEIDRRRPPRPESPRGGTTRPSTRRVDTRRKNKESSWDG